MTIKLGNLADWRTLEGQSLTFTAPDYDDGKSRKVRLDLNSEFACNWYIKQGEHERFLAVIPEGLQSLEFAMSGDFDLMPVRPDGCEIQYWTSEAEEFWAEGDGVTFSTIHERQPRNEAMEWVMFQAAQNQLRRDKAHDEEMALLRAEIGAINERQSGIHGGAAAEREEQQPRPAVGGSLPAAVQPGTATEQGVNVGGSGASDAVAVGANP